VKGLRNGWGHLTGTVIYRSIRFDREWSECSGVNPASFLIQRLKIFDDHLGCLASLLGVDH
jgi:hypothetical protein